MVDANQYINQNYPNGKDIKELDISKKNLTKAITLDNFNSTTRLNASFNQISTFMIKRQLPLEIMDFSHNLLTNFSILPELNSTIQRINLSHNYLSVNGPISDQLTHLDVSNNNLTNLDLSDYVHLTSLDCSKNPNLTMLILSLNSYFDPKDLSNFDCRETNLGTINTTSFTIECYNEYLKIKGYYLIGCGETSG
ncbi:29196_t:CDS:2 [Gigaspora margarita]|uniref:29196_t:CDS:1 n=1 Tax=Gigaspora margarita TaxID=4874 RepID=A0ABN7UFB2_GIGMA|nr:29196_t:CDS:2 [Gigaspora margarita]